MSEHLRDDILRKTDNGNTLPISYLSPLLQSLHQYLWKNPLSNFGKWIHHFERDEFKNRYAHEVAWLEKSIPQLIASNIIRADSPYPITEPELYHLVKTHQTHHCIPSK
ncbi:hypothetical protein C1645_825951 [Glomus cerebriforme]|uniref:Uncharacterized protein n=1 Tax=Glomus cerebriforme TaxID=658196 RepID=A0A397SVR3_9GLOM|nr:hypothetical protein C1645_825951 [Glomus cerebriforme]